MSAELGKILLVDDDPDILEFLSFNLKKEGYTVYTSDNGKEAVSVAKKKVPDLIVLDVMMPEMDGIETCHEIRNIPELQSSVITFLTARGEDYSQIAGFEAGADDYIVKPIKPKVFTSRIKALLKRKDSRLDSVASAEVKGFSVDKDRFLILKDGEGFELPKKEFELMHLLLSKPDVVFTRDTIFDLIWGDDVIVNDRTIDVHIRKLRERFGDDCIRTVRGVGYKFNTR